MQTMNFIRSDKHNMGTVQINMVTLSADDDNVIY